MELHVAGYNLDISYFIILLLQLTKAFCKTHLCLWPSSKYSNIVNVLVTVLS